MAVELAEPVVLAAAKEALYPDVENEPGHYAVTETQFTQDSWGGWSIPDAVRDRLAPFNAVRLESGEPDLLGVGTPATEVLNGGAASTPVVVVEAKGHNRTPGSAPIGRGIEQAHSHLPEVNLGYVAAPIDSVTQTARSLARELNVGVLGVHDAETVELVEPARVTGAGEFSTGIDAIRFQASPHGLTEGSFPLNHPKNFLGYPLALAADGDVDEIYAEHVVRAVSGGRRGAILLDLVDDRGDGEYLTHLGAEVVRFATAECGSVEAALEEFAGWAGKRRRFTEYAPRWAQLARGVTMQYQPTRLVVDALEALHREEAGIATLPQVVEQACEFNKPLAVEVFFTRNRREDVLTRDGDLNRAVLEDPTVYKSGAHFQFKAQLYHVGLLTEGGTDDPDEVITDEWRLEQPVREFRLG